MSLEEILHVLGLAYSLFLISQAIRKGLKVTFLNKDYKILRREEVIKNALKVNNIYILNVI